VDPTGKFLYVANENSRDTSIYTIDTASGALTQITGSPFAGMCGCMSADPTGKFLYVGIAWDVAAYTIDPSSGAPTQINGSPFAGVWNASSVATTKVGH
jgi:6-phosphogluconolactonase (cycloisomerase 2 family)